MSIEKLSTAVNSHHRIVGLDTLRFVCALIVAVGHLGLIPFVPDVNNLQGKAWLADRVYTYAFNGPAAVIVFFVISGFCIHFPFREARRALALGPFYTRRFIRIGIPAAVFCVLWIKTFRHGPLLQKSPFWSILCEVVYYALYPALLLFRRKTNWTTVLGLASLAAIVLLTTHVHAIADGEREYRDLGLLTWIIGLPCWLLGCWLAENYQRFPAFRPWTMWFVRLAIYALSMVQAFARLRTQTAWTANAVALDLFAIPACLWVALEISYYRAHKPPRLGEWAGRWSYSLYLGHPLVTDLLFASGAAPFLDRTYTHWILIVLVLAGSYLYYLAVELPSHRLAIAAGRRTARQSQSTPVVAA